MRRLAAAILALPVIASIYVATLLAVPGARRYLASAAAVLFVGVIGVSLVLPPAASSVPPSSQRPVPSDQLQPVETDFGAASASAAASQPAAGAVNAPSGPGGGTESGRPAPTTTAIADPGPAQTPRPEPTLVATAATVRAATTAKVAGSLPSGKRIRLTSAIVLRFDRPVTVVQVRAAFAIRPAVKGSIRAVTNRVYTFTPIKPLPANTAYTVTFAKPIKDTDGIAVRAPKPVHLLTSAAPALVRFRPSKGTTEVDPTALLSVRFTAAMNRSTTAKAFSVVIAGRKVAGKVTWVEGDSVLVFKPTKVLPKGSGVGLRILGTATSADGVPLKKGGSATFKVVAGPKPAPTAAKPAVKPVVKPGVSRPSKPRTGGGSLGGGSWAAAEAYYLDLMNCTRTGGWVTSSGSCSSPGGRGVAPLWIDHSISANVSRPYAKYLASSGICSHFADGNPGTRLRRAGYDSYKWAENISCPKTMGVMELMVYTQQYFQAEGWGGGHYVNLMNPEYDRVGIGVWVANGVAEVVIDFYHP